MARSCSVCSRSDAGRVNEMLRSDRSARSVAAEFAVGYDALTRHARNHLAGRDDREPGVNTPGSLAPTPSIDPMTELVEALRGRALAGSDAASREYRLALAAQATARHAAAPTLDLAATDEWIALRTTLLEALAPFPKARTAVADALSAAGMD